MTTEQAEDIVEAGALAMEKEKLGHVEIAKERSRA